MALAAGAMLVAALATIAIGDANAAETGTNRNGVEACIAAAQGTVARERCIGKMSDACIGPDEGAKSDSAVIDCLDAEQAQWDRILNASYQALLKGLEPEQQAKLRDMQRAWIDARKKSCDFLYVYFQGTMANPMIANCMNRETARRAIYLRGFADDLADRVKQ
jgi:uncharacterized protein YecT (DUF1311 family)